MMLEELKLIKQCLTQSPTSDQYYKALFILDREIKIKEVDPRREKVDNAGVEMDRD